MGNGLIRRMEKVDVKRIVIVPKFVKKFAAKAYLRNRPEPHYNSANSKIDYKA